MKDSHDIDHRAIWVVQQPADRKSSLPASSHLATVWSTCPLLCIIQHALTSEENAVPLMMSAIRTSQSPCRMAKEAPRGCRYEMSATTVYMLGKHSPPHLMCAIWMSQAPCRMAKKPRPEAARTLCGRHSSAVIDATVP